MANRGYLNQDDLLKCRHISKNWKWSAGKYLEDEDVANKFKKWYTFETPADLETFSKIFENQPASSTPFLTRNVVFSNRSRLQEPPLLLLEKWVIFIKIFGHHIHYCQLDVIFPSCSERSQLKFYSAFKHFLESVPNLKILKLFQWKLDARFQNQCNDKLKKLISIDPLPKMDSLKVIEIHGDGIVPATFYELLAKSPNLKGWIDQRGNFGFKNLKFVPPPVNSIRRILQDKFEEFGGSFRSHGELFTMTYFQWPTLIRVKLVIGELSSIRVETVFQVLESFKNSLKFLELDARHADASCSGRRLQLMLPRLESFAFSIKNSLRLDFLWKMRLSLQRLTVYFEGRIDNHTRKFDQESPVKIYTCVDSTIWKDFSRLKSINVFTGCRGWVYYCRKKMRKNKFPGFRIAAI